MFCFVVALIAGFITQCSETQVFKYFLEFLVGASNDLDWSTTERKVKKPRKLKGDVFQYKYERNNRFEVPHKLCKGKQNFIHFNYYFYFYFYFEF